MRDLVFVIDERSFSGGRKRCRSLSSLDLGIGSRKTDKTLVEMVELGAQHSWSVTRGICGNEDDFNLIGNVGG